MDQSWRFRSSPAPLCPSCSIPHLPFCSAPIPFNRPSFLDIHDPTPRFPPPPLPDPFSMHQSRFFRNEALERDALYKRMRLDDGFADYTAPFRNFSEDERRLDLIRSHGQQQQQAIGENYPVDHMRLNFPKAEPFSSDLQFRGARYAPQLDKFVAEERSEFADRSFKGYDDGRFATMSRELRDGDMQRVAEAVRTQSAYGYMEHDLGNSRDYESRRRREEVGTARDISYQSHAHGDVDGYNGTIRGSSYQSHAHGDVDGYSGTIRGSSYQSHAHGDVDGYSGTIKGSSYQSHAHGDMDGYSGTIRGSSYQSHAHGDVDDYSGTIRGSLYQSHAHRDVDGYSGMVRDSLYKSLAHGDVDNYSEQKQFASMEAAFPPPENPHFGRDRILEHHLQNYAPSRVEYPYYKSGILNVPPECSPPLQLKEVRGSFGIENHLPLERFSPPSWNTTNVHLPVRSGDNIAGPDKAALPEKYPSLPPPQFAPSPPQERPAPHHHISLFPSGPSLAIPHQADPPKSFTAHPPPPPPLPPSPPPPPITTTENIPNSPLYAPALPNNTSTSHLPMVTINTLPAYVLQTPAHKHHQDDRPISTKQPGTLIPVTIDASHIFRKPHRANRPDHIVVILRGLPGSGKSYMAKLLRDLEVEEGGSVPRVHSMDDYFMTEVEKIDDADGQKSSSSVRSRKPVTKTVMEYCYEPEMEEAYRASMLKAFKKTLDEGAFTFVIVDDRNLRVADFAQFWAIGKRSGYEVYLLEAPYKDPMGCAARNVHGFTSDDIQKMAKKWEEAPSLYMQIDAQSLFHVDGLNGQEIKEVEMDMEEEFPCNEKDVPEVQEVSDAGTQGHAIVGYDSQEASRLSDVEEEDVKELGRSKWSNDLDDDITRKHEKKEHLGALSGLVQAYSKPAKSVSWGDQGGRRGFAIGASNNLNNTSLIIGPGTGYNLRSNPVLDEETTAETTSKNANESRKHSIFLEHTRAEHESFRLVFDRRRHRIGISDADDE